MTLTVLDPATEEPIAGLERAGVEETDAPVASAKTAFPAWRTRAVVAGVRSVNSNSSVRTHTPFGGMKQSCFGRELGMAALESYTDIKNVFISTEG